MITKELLHRIKTENLFFYKYLDQELLMNLVVSIELATEALEKLKLDHEHKPGLHNISQCYGDDVYDAYCDTCCKKVTFGPGIAEQALERIYGDNK